MVVAAVNMAPQAWIVIAAIVAATVILCLATVGRLLEYETEFVRVVGQIKVLRARYGVAMEAVDEADAAVGEWVVDPIDDEDTPDNEVADVPMQKAA